MSSILGHWTFNPLVAIAAVVVLAHEIGLAHLAGRSAPERTRRRRRRALLFYAGLALLLVTVTSPIYYWSDSYFYVHMLEHILLMFFVPMLIVSGAPWLPLVHALPVRLRRRLLRAAFLSSRLGWLRAAGRFLTSGVVAVVLFNAAMIGWHIPAPLDFAQAHSAAHLWLMDLSFLLVGVNFWLQILASRPFRQTLSSAGKLVAIIATNFAMFLLAISMSVFTARSWYSVYDHVPGVTLRPFADQQIGAAILWVCGDFWALPTIIVLVRRLVHDEHGGNELIDRLLGRRNLALEEPLR